MNKKRRKEKRRRIQEWKPPQLNARGEPYQAGDAILDRYMPKASPKEREEARENLKRLARFLIESHTRLYDETENRASAQEEAL